MLYSSIFLAASALSGLAVAQVQTSNFTIDPNSVESTTRAAWCRSEFNTCNTLCGNSYKSNSCDANALTYVCTCNNGQSPDMSKYQGSLSTYICNEYAGQCLATNAGNATAQKECQQVQTTCGSETAASIVTSSAASSSSSAAASSGSSAAASATSAMASGSQSASGSAASASSTGAASALSVGNGALVASLFGLFAYAL